MRLEIQRLRQTEAENFREVRRQNNDRAKIDALSIRNRKNLESHESWTSEDWKIIRDFRSEGMQLRASAESYQKFWSKDGTSQVWDSKFQKIDLQTTQDSLNTWDAAILKSLQGVCVDESVATSTSLFNRITDQLAVTHHELGATPTSLSRDNTMTNACTTPLWIKKNSVAAHNSSSDDFSSNWELQDLKRPFPSMGWLHRRSWGNYYGSYGQVASTSWIQKLENLLPKRSLSFFATTQSRYAMECRSWTHYVSINKQEDLCWTPRILISITANRVREFLTGKFEKQLILAEGKAQSEKRSLTGSQNARMIHDV